MEPAPREGPARIRSAPDHVAALVRMVPVEFADQPVRGVCSMKAIHEPESWMKDAECLQVDPELFFPTEHDSRLSYRAARDVCHACPVSIACLAYAMRVEAGLSHHRRHGIWAGTTPKQRADPPGFVALYKCHVCEHVWRTSWADR